MQHSIIRCSPHAGQHIPMTYFFNNRNPWILLLSLTYYSYNSSGTTFSASRHPEKISDTPGENKDKEETQVPWLKITAPLLWGL